MVADLATEQALLGAVLQDAVQAGPALRSVPKDAWASQKHQALAVLMSDMLTREQPVDPTTVLGQLSVHGLVTKIDGSFLANLYNGPYFPFHAEEYAARIIEIGAQRHLQESLTRTLAQMGQDWDAGDGIDVTTAVSQLRQTCDQVQTSALAVQEPPTSLADLLATEDHYNWLVPGLLERGERIVLTGGEGSGKSVLVSQIAGTLCGGLHPFTASLLGSGDYGLRVLVVDCENSEVQTKRRYRRIVRNVDDARGAYDLGPADWRNQFFVHCRPEGLDLTQGRDITWLEHAVSAVAPDLLVLGPLYKLHAGDPSDEGLAHELIHAIDSIRARHNCALITEAHAGHATDGNGDRKMRPTGSSLWLRWPEFGYGLRRAKPVGELSSSEERVNRERPLFVDVVAWRGSREERSWPTALQHGRTLPWTPSDPDYFADAEEIRGF